MLIAKCPECHDPIRIPELATEASRACCPWCQQTYYLADVFETLPPVVEIIDGPGSNQGGINAEIVTDGSASSYGLVNDGSSTSDFNFQESNSTGSSGAPTAKIKRSERRPRKQSSGAFEFAKIIGGGVAGCIIAVSVVWYGFGKPMGFEDNLPGWTYVVVPEHIRTEVMLEAAANANPGSVSHDPQTIQQPSNTTNSVESVSAVEPTKLEDATMPETGLGKAFQQAVENSTIKEKPQEKAVVEEIEIEEPMGEEDLTLELPVFESEISQDLTDLVENLSLELGPIGAEIPTPEEIEAANSAEEESEEEGTEEKEAEESAGDE